MQLWFCWRWSARFLWVKQMNGSQRDVWCCGTCGRPLPLTSLSHVMQLLWFNTSFARWWRQAQANSRTSISGICKGASFAVASVAKGWAGQAEGFGSKKCYFCRGKLSGIWLAHSRRHILPTIWVAQSRVSRRYLLPSPVFAHIWPLSNLLSFLESFWEAPLLYICLPRFTFLPEEGEWWERNR